MRLETRFGAGFKPFGNQVSSHFVFTERCVYIQGLLHREGPSHRDGFLQRDDFTKGCFYVRVLLRGDTFNTEMLLHTGALRYKYFYTEMILLTQAPLHRDAFTQVFLHVNTSTVHGVLRTHSFTLRFLYTKALLHRGILTHTHTVAVTFTCKYFYAAVFILRAFSLHARKLCHRDAFDQTCFYTEIFLHGDTFAKREMPFYTQILLQRDDFTLGNFYTETKTNRGAFTKECMCTKGF